MTKSNKKAILFALMGYSVLACGDFLNKKLSGVGFNPFEIAFFLNLCMLPVLLIFSPWIGGIKPTLRTNKLGLHTMRSLLGMVIFFIVITSFHKLGLSLSYTLMFAAPFFATILSHFFLGNKVHIHRWTSVVAGFIGVMIVLRPWQEAVQIEMLLLLLAAFLIACSHILTRHIGAKEPLMTFSFFGAVLAIQIFGVFNFYDGQSLIPKGSDWAYLIAMAFCYVGGGLMTARALSSADTSLIAPFHYIQLLWGLLFGYLFFATVPDEWSLIGALVIVASGLYLIHREHVRQVKDSLNISSLGSIEKEHKEE